MRKIMERFFTLGRRATNCLLCGLMIFFMLMSASGKVSAQAEGNINGYKECPVLRAIGANLVECVKPCTTGDTAPVAAPSASAEAILQALRALPIREKIGAMLVAGFTDKDQAKTMVGKYQLGGVFLDRHSTPLFNKAVLDDIKTAGKVTPLVVTDQEGGVVEMEGVGMNYPSARDLGKLPDDQITAKAKEMAQKMVSLGITVDFAPVADLDDSSNDIISKFGRAFAKIPDDVTAKSIAFAKGLREGGITPVYKHFPGHGRATGKPTSDSHQNAVTTPSLADLKANDLKPYEKVQSSGTAGVMVGHLIVPDLTNGVQATISKPAIDLLRNDYHFDQVVFSDEIAGMKAIIDKHSVEDAVSLSIQAGVDMPMFIYNGQKFPGGFDSQIKAIVDKIESETKPGGKIPEDRINQSLARIAAFKAGNQPVTTTTATTAPGAPAAAGTAGGKVYVIGDSLAKGMEADLNTELKKSFSEVKINGLVSRSLPAGLTAINTDKDFVAQASTVIVELGTNTSGDEAAFRKQATDMVATINSINPNKPRIFWVNVAGVKASKPTYASYNKVLKEMADTKVLTVINWFGAVDSKTDPTDPKGPTDEHNYFASDSLGVHPTANGGFAKMIETIVNTVGTAAVAAPNPAATTQCCSAGPAASTTTLPAGSLPAIIPEPYNGAMTAGAKKHNVAPALIAAIFTEENFTHSPTSSLAGNWAAFPKKHPDPNSGWPTNQYHTMGAFQFIPGTWAAFGDDGNGDGIKDAQNFADGAAGAANYLAHNGGTADKPPAEWRKAIFAYNHANWYVDAVLKYYEFYNSGAGGAAVPGATPAAASPPTSACPSAASGSGIVNADGYSFPVEPQKQSQNKGISGLSGLPCGNPTGCHHAGPRPCCSPAFDIGRQPGGDASTGAAVYAISDGQINSVHDNYSGQAGCFTVQMKSTKDSFIYAYLHISNPTIKAGDQVKSGQKIAEIGRRACTGNGSLPHLHIDRGCIQGGVYKSGGSTDCRDPGMVPLINAIFNALPQ